MLSFGFSSIAIKIGLAVLAAIAALGGGWFAYDAVYSRGFTAASAQYQTSTLQAALAEAQKQLRDQQEVITEHEQRAEKDAAQIAILKEQANATPNNDAVCFDADAARRIDGVR